MKTRISLLGCLVLWLMIGNIEKIVAQPGTDCLIKGIIGSNGQKMYLMPGHYLYDKVTPDLNKGERWFCEPQGAERAGFIFVPDPAQPDLRPQLATPTPSPRPTATPEPQPTAPEEIAPEQPVTEALPPEEAPSSEPAAIEVPTPESLTPTSVPLETEEPEVPMPPDDRPFPPDAPFSQTEPPGTFLQLLGLILQQLPPEAASLILAWMGVFFGIIGVLILITIVVRWRIFDKAGQPGWGALIPIYSEVLMLQVAGLAWWWIILAFLPLVNLAFAIVWIFIRPFKMAENFGKGFLYGLGLFLPIISILFLLHLAFSDAEYVGP